MKKTMLAVLTLLVGTLVSAQQFPASLPIGDRFLSKALVTVRLVQFQPQPFGWVQQTVNYSKEDGPIETVASNLLADFVAGFFATNTSDGKYSVQIEVDADVGLEFSGSPYPFWEAGQYLPGPGWTNTVNLTAGGKAFPPELLSLNLTWDNSYAPSYMPGLKSVRLLVNDSGRVLDEETPNGVENPWCSSYPGNGGYISNILWVPDNVACPRERSPDVTGTVTAYLSDDHRVFAIYDLVTGLKLTDSGELGPMLTISIVPLGPGMVVKGIPSTRVKITVGGVPQGQAVTLEYRDSFNGVWRELTTLVSTTGTVETIDGASSPQRFYRARLGNSSKLKRINPLQSQ